MNPILLCVFVGLFAGICRSTIGYFKNSSGEEFEWLSFLKTVVISAILGAIVGLFTPDWKIAFASVFTGTVIVNDILLGIIRQKTG